MVICSRVLAIRRVRCVLCVRSPATRRFHGCAYRGSRPKLLIMLLRKNLKSLRLEQKLKIKHSLPHHPKNSILVNRAKHHQNIVCLKCLALPRFFRGFPECFETNARMVSLLGRDRFPFSPFEFIILPSDAVYCQF
jgi:hypothetical protein